MDQIDELCVELDTRITTGSKAVLEEAFLQRIVNVAAQGGVPWLRLKDVFRSRGKLKMYEPEIQTIVRDLKKVTSIGGAPRSEETFVKEYWEDAPVHSEAVIPKGWSIAGHDPAIMKMSEKKIDGATIITPIPICYDPLVITRRIQQIEHGTIMLEVAWKTESRWHRSLFGRDTVFTTKEIVRTSALGMPVGQDNAMDLVQYLRAYENANRKQIKIGYMTGRLGWQGERGNPTSHGFVLPERQIGGNGKAIDLAPDGNHEFTTEGSFEVWKEAMAMIDPWPALRVGIYAALAAPLIAILKAPNCIVEWAGDTSAGKSVVLEIAQSCWKDGTAKLMNWGTTVNGLEARAQSLNDMPFIIDDTAKVQESKRRDLLTSAIYMLESGHTRTRATKDMTERESGTWRTIVMSTGEYTLAEHAGTGGAAARVLTFWGAPLGESSDRTGETIEDVKMIIGENYGHAGPKLVEWLCEHRDQWDHLKSNYRRYISAVRKSLHSPAAMRLAPTIALLQVTAEVASECLGLPWTHKTMLDDPYVMAAIERAVRQATVAANKPRQAWDHALSYANSRPSQWVSWGDQPKPSLEPASGWLGWRMVEGPRRLTDEGKTIDPYFGDLYAWHPSQLKKVLEAENFPFEATLRSWRDKGVLISDEGRLNVKCSCDGSRSGLRVYVIRSGNDVWKDA